jgi:hypothetical protein
MNKFLALVLCAAMPLAVFAADNSYKVTYDGGSVADVKAGTGMKLFIDSNQLRLVKDKDAVVTIPASAVTEISYGQDVQGESGPRLGWPWFLSA